MLLALEQVATVEDRGVVSLQNPPNLGQGHSGVVPQYTPRIMGSCREEPHLCSLPLKLTFSEAIEVTDSIADLRNFLWKLGDGLKSGFYKLNLAICRHILWRWLCLFGELPLDPSNLGCKPCVALVMLGCLFPEELPIKGSRHILLKAFRHSASS